MRRSAGSSIVQPGTKIFVQSQQTPAVFTALRIQLEKPLSTRRTQQSPAGSLKCGFKQLKIREGRNPGTSPRTEAVCLSSDSLILVFKDHCHSSLSKKRDHSVYFLCLRGFSDRSLILLPWCITACHRQQITFGIFVFFWVSCVFKHVGLIFW